MVSEIDPEDRNTTEFQESATATTSLSPFVIRSIFLLLGVGILIPWNAFVSAKSYFQARMCKSGTFLLDVEQWFGLVWNCSSVISLGLSMTFSTTKGQQGGHRSKRAIGLVVGPLSLYLIVFLTTSALVLVPDMEPGFFVFLTLLGLAVCGICGAIATAGIVSASGFFESHLGVTPFFAGQAVGGVAVAVANFVAASLEDPRSYWEESCSNDRPNIHFLIDTMAFESKDHRNLSTMRTTTLSQCSAYHTIDWSVFAFFFAGCIVLVLCLLGYTVIETSIEAQNDHNYVVVEDDRVSIESRIDEHEQPATNLESGPDAMQEAGQTDDDRDCFVDEGWNEPMDVAVSASEANEMSIFAALKGPASCVFLAFTVTLSVFPTHVSQLRSVYSCKSHFRLYNDLFVPLTFVIFNAGDLCGRLLAEAIPIHQVGDISSKLVVASLCRILFLPLFFMCLTGHSFRTASFPIIRSDVYSVIVQFAFAITNGVLVSCSFMQSSQVLRHDPATKEKASKIMTFAVFLGLLCGSLLSFPLEVIASAL